MPDPFATALAVLHAGPCAVAAAYRPADGSSTIGLMVIRHRPTIDLPFGDTTIPVGSNLLEIRVEDVARPASGDVVDLGTEQLQITGEPRLDVEGLTWTCEAVEA